MLTFERRVWGQLIPERPGLEQRPQLAVLRMTTSTGAVPPDYDFGFALGPLAQEADGVRIYAICSCDVIVETGAVSPDTIWAYGDNGRLRGFNVRTGKEVDVADVPPGSVLRIVMFGN